MKKILLAFLSLAFLTAGAQTADEVVQKYAAAMGGLDKFNKIKSAKFTGNVLAQGQELPITIRMINGRAVRVDVDVMGQQIITAYKDGKGWKQNPFAGQPDPVDAEASDLVEFKSQSALASPLMDYKARGHKVELLGQEDVAGKKAFKIKLTSKDDGKETTYFIDATNYGMIKTTADREMMGQTMPIDTWYSDPKEFNGVKVYMTRSNKIEEQEMQTIQFETVELDVTIDEKIYDKP